MLSNYIAERTPEANAAERGYLMFLIFMQSALGDEAADKLFKQARKAGKYITQAYEEDELDGEEYVLTSVKPY